MAHHPARLALAMALAFAGLTAAAQGYPTKPIRMIVSGVGGSSNFSARLIAPYLSGGLGQQVVVDNRGSGVVAIELAARAQPDGYTFILNGSNLWLLPFMRDKLPWDPVKDFAPVSCVITAPNILAVHPSVAARDVRELITLAKARPGALNYATSGTGNSNHLAAELFKAMAGLDMVQINYKGAAPASTDLIAGRVQVMFPTPGSVTQHIKAGRLRALAVTSTQPSPLLPGLPTVAQSGLPGYESVSIFGMFAPAGTPPAIVARMNREVARALAQADVKERILGSGVEPAPSTPEGFGTMIRTEMTRLGKLIKDAGIRDD